MPFKGIKGAGFLAEPAFGQEASRVRLACLSFEKENSVMPILLA